LTLHFTSVALVANPDAACAVRSAFPTGRGDSAGGIDPRWRAAGWSADARAFADDPNVARPRLKPIHRCRDVARRRLGRPALADASDLAAALQVL
jgi:hypothetical protein